MELSQSSEGSYYDGMYADPPVVKRVQLRDAGTIDSWLTSDDGTTVIAIDCTMDIDFDRQQIVKVVRVDSVIFKEPKNSTNGDIRHNMSADAQKFWTNRAQVYADNLGQWELDYLRDKVRKQVMLVGN